MTENEDRRSQKRIKCDVSTYIRRVDDHFIYRAKIKNYDAKGLYFETDRTLSIGDEVFLSLDGEVGDITSNATYRAKIIWMSRFESSQFRYGYGAWDTTKTHLHERKDIEDNKSSVEMRNHDRRRYLQPVLYIKGTERIKGSIKNISLGGLFIDINENFENGQIVHFIIPDKNTDGGLFMKCEVIHQNQSGTGLKLKKIIKN